MLREIPIVSVLTVAALVGAAAAEPNRATGLVRGTVLTGPTCPGPAQRDRNDCAARPLQTTVKIFAANARSGNTDEPLTTVSTDGNGHFQITLAPGAYRLVPASPGGISVGKPSDVTVAAGSTMTITLFVDTGMR